MLSKFQAHISRIYCTYSIQLIQRLMPKFYITSSVVLMLIFKPVLPGFHPFLTSFVWFLLIPTMEKAKNPHFLFFECARGRAHVKEGVEGKEYSDLPLRK